MSAFSTKYKIHASSTTVKLMDKYENPLPGIIVSTALIDGDLSEAINAYQTTGLYSKSLAYYRYGAFYYPRGLPTGNLRNANVDAAAILHILEAEVENEVEILYVLFDSEFIDHFVSVYMQDIREVVYNTTLIVINPPGITGEVFYSHWDQVDLTDQIRLHYVTSLGAAAGTEIVDFPYATNKAYQVLYRLLDVEFNPVPDTDPIYWMYVEESPPPPIEGEEPIPDVLLIPEADVTPLMNNNYFPIIPFYEDQIIFGSEANASALDEMYLASKKLIGKLGINYADLAASLAEGPATSLEEGSGLYVHFVLSAELTAGAAYTKFEDLPEEGEIIPPLTSAERDEIYLRTKPHQAVMHYLFEFFLAEMGNSKYGKSAFDSSYKYGTYKRAPRHNSILITDEAYQYTLSYYYITVTQKEGQLIYGTPGSYVTEVIEGNIEVETIKEEGIKPNTTCLFIRKQIDMSNYLEIEICGLAQSFKIYKSTSSITYLDDAFRDEDPLFMTVPLNYELVKKTPVRYRNILIASSMHLTINSYVIEEVKWYQTGLFRAILTIISVVLSPFTGGASLSLLTVLRVVAYMIIMNLLISYVIIPIFKYVAKILGPEAAAILAVILTTAALVTGNVKLAKNLLEISRYVFMGVDAQLQQEMEDLQKDYAKLKSESELLKQELERAQGLLDNPMNFDPMTMVTGRSNVVWGESADAFITGRLQLPATSLAIIQTPGIFVEMMVRLPSINETLNIR